MHETAEQAVRVHPRVALAPVVARRMLCFDLEQLVRTAGVTHQIVAEWLGVSRPAVTAAMRGKTLFSRPAVEVICTRLERDEWLPRLDGLLTTARRTPGAPEPEPGPRDAALVIGLEAFADEVTVFDPWLVPALLHTQMYATALVELDNAAHNTAREQRQAALLTSSDPLPLRWITSEQALHRQVRTLTVREEQQAFLAEVTERENITVSVISGTTDLPPVAPFCLVRGTTPVVVESSRLTVHYATDPVTVDHFTHLTDSLVRRALNPEDSARLIRQMRR
jgi:hypothetical protein